MNSTTVKPVKLDEIGDWSAVKLGILRKYSHAYSTILTKIASTTFTLTVSQVPDGTS